MGKQEETEGVQRGWRKNDGREEGKKDGMNEGRRQVERGRTTGKEEGEEMEIADRGEGGWQIGEREDGR